MTKTTTIAELLAEAIADAREAAIDLAKATRERADSKTIARLRTACKEAESRVSELVR